MYKIFIATTSFGEFSNKPIEFLENNGCQIKKNSSGQKLCTKDLKKELINCIGVIAGTEEYKNNVLNEHTNLKVISRLGVGMDNIDLGVAHENCIKVYKTQTTPAQAVSELTMGIILSLARNISQTNRCLKEGQWNKQMGSLLIGKTLGIIGLGNIGKSLVRLSRGFQFKILAFDKHEDYLFAKENDVTYCNLETLLNNSDIISIHLNLSEETNQIINKEKIKLMKPTAFLINTSRGDIIDEKALYNALNSNKLAGAGLDVFSREPYSGPLAKLDNVVLTPHIGSYAREIRVKMEMEAAENLIKGLNEI